MGGWQLPAFFCTLVTGLHPLNIYFYPTPLNSMHCQRWWSSLPIITFIVGRIVTLHWKIISYCAFSDKKLSTSIMTNSHSLLCIDNQINYQIIKLIIVKETVSWNKSHQLCSTLGHSAQVKGIQAHGIHSWCNGTRMPWNWPNGGTSMRTHSSLSFFGRASGSSEESPESIMFNRIQILRRSKSTLYSVMNFIQ